MPRHPTAAASASGLTGNVFEALARRIREHAGPLVRLNVGDTWMEPPECARAESLTCVDHPLVHSYAPPQGEPALLDAIERRLAQRGPARPREAIQVCSGATVGLSLACQTVLDPGDEVIVPEPYWPLIPGIVASRGAVPVAVPVFTRLEQPAFDLEAELEHAVTPRTAALYLNTPHNPTGVVLDDAQLEAVGRVAKRHDLWVLSDEVYEDLWHATPPPAPAWARAGLRERTIAVHSLSKSHGLAGARVGWIHGPEDVMRAVRAVHYHQVYGAARPMQVLAARALEDGAAWLDHARAVHREACRTAAAALGLPAPEAGTFLFFDAAPWLAGAPDALPFLERCIDAGVVLTPGTASGGHFPTWVRLCFTCVPPDALRDALERVRSVMDAGRP